MKNIKPAKLILLSLIFAAMHLASQSSFAQTEPKIEGSPFTEIKYKHPTAPPDESTREEMEKNAKIGIGPVVGTKGPKKRTRGDDPLEAAGRTIYQFTNHDFKNPDNTCGQAAVATAMWNKGLKEKWNANAPDFATQLYRYAPPKITVPGLGSNGIGTDWHQINYALDGYKKYGIKYSWFKGRDLLNKYINMGLPCIIMMDMGVFGGNFWGVGHWVVAFARTNSGYYVTNNNTKYISWTNLNRAWGGVWNEGQLAKVHGTSEMFCVVWN